MLQLVKIAAGCCAALIMIEFIEVDAFGADFILIVMTAVSPFRNSMSTTFNATTGEDTTLDPID